MESEKGRERMRKRLALHYLRKETEERAMWKGNQAGGDVLSWTLNLGIFLQNQIILTTIVLWTLINT